MQPARFVCLFVILAGVLVVAQSSRVPLANQSNALPIAQQRHPALPPNLSQMPQGALLDQHRARAFKKTAIRRGGSSSGLNFAPAVDYGSGGQDAQSVAVADVNGDGKPDLLVANAGSNSVGVLLGNGDGTFQTAVLYPSGGYGAISVAVADVNGDRKPDLIVANVCGDSKCATSGTVGVLLGNGDGTFQVAATYDSGGYSALSVAALDVNRDGKPDLLVANGCAIQLQNCTGDGVVGVLLGNGDGTFQAAVSYDSGGQYAYAVAVADVNGDGKPDLLVANWSSNSVGVLLGNGDGIFPGGGDLRFGWSANQVDSSGGCERGWQARCHRGQSVP